QSIQSFSCMPTFNFRVSLFSFRGCSFNNFVCLFNFGCKPFNNLKWLFSFRTPLFNFSHERYSSHEAHDMLLSAPATGRCQLWLSCILIYFLTPYLYCSFFSMNLNI